MELQKYISKVITTIAELENGLSQDPIQISFDMGVMPFVNTQGESSIYVTQEADQTAHHRVKFSIHVLPKKQDE